MYSSGWVDDAVEVDDALLSTRTPMIIVLGPVPMGYADSTAVELEGNTIVELVVLRRCG